MSPFCSFAPTSVVRGVMPKWRMIATYSALNGRLPLPSPATFLPSGIRCVAAVELSVW